MNEFSKLKNIENMGDIVDWHDERISKLEDQSSRNGKKDNYDAYVRFLISRDVERSRNPMQDAYFWPEETEYNETYYRTPFEKVMLQLCIGVAFLVSIYCLLSGSLFLFPLFSSVALLAAFYDWEKRRR